MIDSGLVSGAVFILWRICFGFDGIATVAGGGASGCVLAVVRRGWGPGSGCGVGLRCLASSAPNDNNAFSGSVEDAAAAVSSVAVGKYSSPPNGATGFLG